MENYYRVLKVGLSLAALYIDLNREYFIAPSRVIIRITARIRLRSPRIIEHSVTVQELTTLWRVLTKAVVGVYECYLG